MAGQPQTRAAEDRAPADGASGTPARGYSWPPFEKGNDIGPRAEPGNQLALRHGAYSPRKVDPLAEQLVHGILELVEESPERLGYLAAPEFRPALWSWARTEARVQLLHEFLLDEGGDLDADGITRPAAELLVRLEKAAESLRTRLGMDPLSRARLGRDTAAGSLDLARLMAAVVADRDDDQDDGTEAEEDES
jgi:hypothetical protein